VSSVARALIVALLTFMSALLGFFVQWLLPAQHEADAVTGSIIGLVTLLLALVLGLLVWMSYGLYATQSSESQTLGPLILKLDFVLEQYGPEACRGRDLLRATVVRARDRFWAEGGRAGGVLPYTQARADLQDITAFFATLEPVTDQQKQLIVAAMPIFMQVVETTLLLTRRLANRVPKLLIGGHRMVVAFVHELRTARHIQRLQHRSGGAGVDRRRQRHFPDSRVQPALFRPGPHFAGRRRQPDRRARTLKARNASVRPARFEERLTHLGLLRRRGGRADR
jgi:hypothetical protein